MNWKMFLSTFALIFLAELGDKTQLAAMARATTSESAKWTVFFAASSALVLSTLIAVLLGSVLSRFINPDHLKIAAATMFIIFGLIIFWQVFGPKKELENVKSEPSRIGAFVLRTAMEFEKAASEDYQAMAEKASDPKLKTFLMDLAEEEEGHLKQVSEYASQPMAELAEEEYQLPEPEHLLHDVAKSDQPILEHAIEHEEATENFYTELASITPMPSLKTAFTTLAKAEHNHAQRLRDFAGTPDQEKKA